MAGAAPYIPQLDAGAPKEEMARLLEEHGCLVLLNYAEESKRAALEAELRAKMASSRPDPEGTLFGDVRIPEDQVKKDGPITPFAGNTYRFTAVATNFPAARPFITDPRLLGMCDSHLLPNCERYQLHVSAALIVGPGARRQVLHREEDMFHQPFKVPRPNMILASMLAVTDFTPENGGTLIVPGSHRWEKGRKAKPEEIVAAAMPKGSLLFWAGGTYHASGHNATEDEWRLGLILTYSLGWLRTEENHNLDIPPSVARTLSPELRRLVGYEPYEGGTIGFFDKELVARQEQLAAKL